LPTLRPKTARHIKVHFKKDIAKEIEKEYEKRIKYHRYTILGYSFGMIISLCILFLHPFIISFSLSFSFLVLLAAMWMFYSIYFSIGEIKHEKRGLKEFIESLG